MFSYFFLTISPAFCRYITVMSLADHMTVEIVRKSKRVGVNWGHQLYLYIYIYISLYDGLALWTTLRRRWPMLTCIFVADKAHSWQADTVAPEGLVRIWRHSFVVLPPVPFVFEGYPVAVLCYIYIYIYRKREREPYFKPFNWVQTININTSNHLTVCKQMISGSFIKVDYKPIFYKLYIYIYI